VEGPRKQWIRLGFLGRAVPVSYRLAPEDILRREERLYRGEAALKPVKLDLLDKPVRVAVPQGHAVALKRLGRVIAAVNQDEMRFRSHRHILVMAKASAIREGREEVS